MADAGKNLDQFEVGLARHIIDISLEGFLRRLIEIAKERLYPADSTAILKGSLHRGALMTACRTS